jgi:hypothetical protein
MLEHQRLTLEHEGYFWNIWNMNKINDLGLFRGFEPGTGQKMTIFSKLKKLSSTMFRL